MATIQHSLWVPSPGLSLMMSSSLGSTMLEQGANYAVPVHDMLYGERTGEDDDPWVAFVQASFEPDRRRRRRRRR